MNDDTTQTLFCANHPGRETVLRCNRCGKPICYQCAVQTPVGYRCKECVRGQQAVFYNGTKLDLLIGGLVAFGLALILGVLAYLFLGMLGWFRLIVALFVGPAAGGAIAEVIRQAVHRRRTKEMRWVAAGCAVLGVLAGGILLYGFTMGAHLSAVSLAFPYIATSLLRLDVALLAGSAVYTLYVRLK